MIPIDATPGLSAESGMLDHEECAKTADVSPSELAAPPCSVEFTGRQVIENKLLTALEDEGTVAALLNKDDLEVMITALTKYKHRRAQGLAKDMQQLLDAAFPPNAEICGGETKGKL